MSARNLLKRDMDGSYKVNLEETLRDGSPFDFLLDEDRSVYLEDYPRVVKKSKNVSINEATKREILSGADSARKQRAKYLKVRYLGVTQSRGWIKFETNSQYTPSLKYTQYIKLKEAKDMKYFKEFKKEDIIKLFLSGDIQIYCSCPDFRYRQKYMAWNLGYGIFKEMRYPKIRNPHLKGTVCKHLIAVLQVLPKNEAKIAKDMKKSKFFKKKYEDKAYLNSLDDSKSKKKNKGSSTGSNNKKG